jgi:hypothetical protein
MSRTHKKQQIYNCHRSLKGNLHKQAKLLSSESTAPVRKGAVPPNPWEDLQIDKQCFKVYDYIEQLDKQKLPMDEIAIAVHKRFHEVSINYVRDLMHRRALVKARLKL